MKYAQPSLKHVLHTLHTSFAHSGHSSPDSPQASIAQKLLRSAVKAVVLAAVVEGLYDVR